MDIAEATDFVTWLFSHDFVAELVAVPGSHRQELGVDLSELADHLDQAARRLALANGGHDAVDVRLPAGVADPLVDRLVAEDNNAVLELRNQDQHAGAIARTVQAPFAEQCEGAALDLGG